MQEKEGRAGCKEGAGQDPWQERAKAEAVLQTGLTAVGIPNASKLIYQSELIRPLVSSRVIAAVTPVR
eukprot:scaffold171958_cov14-Prasinocladus_malaysianus.AAC.1